MIIDIFVIEFKRIKNDKYKQTLLEIILKNNNLISYSYPFMSLIINQFLSSEPSLIGDNIQNFQIEDSTCLQLINNANNKILNEILLFY